MSTAWNRPKFPFRAPEPIRDLIAAINDKARAAQAGLFTMLIVGVYIVATALSTTDLDLLTEKSTPIAQLGIHMPVLVSFAIAPLVFLGLHVFTLIRYHFLALDLRRFNTELEYQVPDTSNRDRCKRLLANTEFVQIMCAPADPGRDGFLVHAIAWGLLAILPVAVLVIVEVSTLRLQNTGVYAVQLFAILTDILLVEWFRRGVRALRSNRQALGAAVPSSRWQWPTSIVMVSRIAALAYLAVLMVFYARPPGENAGTVLTGRAMHDHQPHPTSTLAWNFVVQPLDLITCPDWRWGCRYLSVEHRTLVSQVWDKSAIAELRTVQDPNKYLPSVEGLLLANRNLAFADFRGSRLYGAQFDGAHLEHAEFTKAGLQGAEFSRAHLDNADIFDAKLQDAVLFEAKLEGAVLTGASLQGAVLDGASLQRAHLGSASLQGAHAGSASLQRADLTFAKLQGAVLNNAKLQGAFLEDAELQGAFLEGAELQGADLTSAKLPGADLEGAKLQGAYLGSASLQGAFLDYAKLQGADLTSAKLQGADLSYAALYGAYGKVEISLADLSRVDFTSFPKSGTTTQLVKLEAGSDHQFLQQTWLPDAVQRILAAQHPGAPFPDFQAEPHSVLTVVHGRHGRTAVPYLSHSFAATDETAYRTGLARYLATRVAVSSPAAAAGIALYRATLLFGQPWLLSPRAIARRRAIGCALLSAKSAKKVSFAGYEDVLAELKKAYPPAKCHAADTPSPATAVETGMLPDCTPTQPPADDPDKGWRPLGLDGSKPLSVKALMVKDMVSGGVSKKDAKLYAAKYIASGSTVPTVVEDQTGTVLEKVVPADIKPTRHTGYWATPKALYKVLRHPRTLIDALSLPPSSVAERYDVYEIVATVPAELFQSTIAPTEDTVTCRTQAGGAQQTLVMNRARFGSPVEIGSVSVPREK